MLEQRSGSAAVVYENYIYIIGGGNSDDGTLNSIERFNLESGKSEFFAKLQKGRRWHRAVVVDDKIYVLGGSTSYVVKPTQSASGQIRPNSATIERYGLTNGPTSAIRVARPDASVEIIDLKTKAVSEGPRMPEPRNEFGCAVVGQKIYVIGGQGFSSGRPRCTNLVAILDIQTGKWSSGPLLPSPRENNAVVIDGQFIVVPGGYNGTMATQNVEVLNIRDMTWRVLPPLHKPVSAYSLAYLGPYLFLFGDYDSPQELTAYDLRTKSSEAFTLGYTAARHTCTVVVDNRVYVIGGRSSAGALDVIQVFELTGK